MHIAAVLSSSCHCLASPPTRQHLAEDVSAMLPALVQATTAANSHGATQRCGAQTNRESRIASRHGGACCCCLSSTRVMYVAPP
jgi:hypothetical protein